jgi:acetoin utilization deacetylase AcuC-like enzyme
VRVFYSPAYAGSAHAFDTTRKATWIADSLAESPISGIELLEPSPLTRAQLAQVHDANYIRAVETGIPRELAESQGFPWDVELWPMVLSSNGGAVAAGLAALEHGVAGSLSSGLHHARRERGAGFCTFNGLVIAAREALTAGARSVLILDLDAHCGGGTRSMILEDPRIWQVDVAVDSYDRYEHSDHAWLEIVRDGASYLATVDRLLNEADRRGVRFDLCLYNAGMDPYEKCTTGGMPGITRDVLARRERLIFAWCQGRRLPVAFVLAGGYVGSRLDEAGLIDLHLLTLTSASEASARLAP